MNRVADEFELVCSAFPEAELRDEGGAHWVLLPKYVLPNEEVFQQGPSVELCFRIPAQVGEAPYGFWVRPGLELVGGPPLTTYSFPAATPWGTDFGMFSWSPLDPWVPTEDLRAGANMLNFVQSFADRLKDGA